MEISEELINIPLMTMKRLQRQAIDHLGRNWNHSHDKFVINRLFREQVITDYQRTQLLEKIRLKVQKTRARNPDYGKFRLW